MVSDSIGAASTVRGALWRARPAWVALATYRLVLGWLLALPMAWWLGDVLIGAPGHDTRLWEQGGLLIVELAFRHGREALPLIRLLGVGLLFATWAQLFPLAVLIVRLGHGPDPSNATGLRTALRTFPALSAAFGVFSVAYVLLGGAFALSAVWSMEQVGIDTFWPALQTAVTVALLGIVLAMLSLLHDAVRVGLVLSVEGRERGLAWAFSSCWKRLRGRMLVWAAASAMSVALWILGAGLMRALAVDGVWFYAVASAVGLAAQLGIAVARASWLATLVVDFRRDEARRRSAA